MIRDYNLRRRLGIGIRDCEFDRGFGLRIVNWGLGMGYRIKVGNLD